MQPRAKATAWLIATLTLAVVIGSFSALPTWSQAPADSKTSRFDLPRLHAALVNAMQSKKWDETEAICRRMLAAQPNDFLTLYNFACAQARRGQADMAIGTLEKAVENGFADAAHALADDDLESLRGRDQFDAVVAKMKSTNPQQAFANALTKTVTPSLAADGVLLVDEGNTYWNSVDGIFRTLVRFPEQRSAIPIAENLGPAGDLLKQWQKEGTAAGNAGDLYDNHDTDHSNMDYQSFPQLTRVEYSATAQGAQVHHGLQTQFLFNAPTLGNSSTAITNGPFWRSQPRLALTNPRNAAFLAAQYTGNQIYVYPEHRDHDPGRNGRDGQGHGDVYPCNTPYLIISQGSSGSDRVFLNAIAATMAAFQPEVKTKLVQTGLLMPTVQQILRRSMKTLDNPEDYFTGKAHPTVFDGEKLDIVRMVTIAHEMTVDTIPPIVRLQVLSEEPAIPNRDYFDANPTETLWNTPQAICRIAKSTRYLRRMVVSAENSRDVSQRPLKYRWAVLRGNASEIVIEPKNESGSVVSLQIPYHTRQPVPGNPDIESTRVDIGVFSMCDEIVSAPAFVSVMFLDNEQRVYDESRRIVSVDYANPEVAGNYVDPLIAIPKRWRDEYRYDDQGQLQGWTRIRGTDRQSFAADGKLVTKQDEKGNVLESKPVQYVPAGAPGQQPMLEQRLPETRP